MKTQVLKTNPLTGKEYWSISLTAETDEDSRSLEGILQFGGGSVIGFGRKYPSFVMDHVEVKLEPGVEETMKGGSNE